MRKSLKSLFISNDSFSQYVKQLSNIEYGLYKGQRGKIGVVGGSEEFSGAPYYAGITAEQMGSDLIHIFSHPLACIPIKSYSPNLIVHPLMEPGTNQFGVKEKEKLSEQIKKLDAIIVGPGCGRSEIMQSVMDWTIRETKRFGIPLICDADVFRLPQHSFRTLIGYRNSFLTPNLFEFSLVEKLLNDDDDDDDDDYYYGERKNTDDGYYGCGDTERNQKPVKFDKDDKILFKDVEETECLSLIQRVVHVASKLEGPVVFLKWKVDIIATVNTVLAGTAGTVGTVGAAIDACALVPLFEGSIRRCGGQGDVLAGAAASLLGLQTARSRRLRAEGAKDFCASAVDVEVCASAVAGLVAIATAGDQQQQQEQQQQEQQQNRGITQHQLKPQHTAEKPTVLIFEKLLCAATASAVVRSAAETTENDCDGFMTTPDLINRIGKTFRNFHKNLTTVTTDNNEETTAAASGLRFMLFA